jgi:hypothetical protein
VSHLYAIANGSDELNGSDERSEKMVSSPNGSSNIEEHRLVKICTAF